MLDTLLKQIQFSQTVDPVQLSKLLGIHPRMIQSMLGTLTEMGYLLDVSICDDSHCQGCPVSSSCSSLDGKAHLWKIKPSQ